MKYCKTLLQLVTVAVISLALQVECGPVSRPHSIKKRTVFQMCALITHHTGRSCLDFNGYGCFCGLGNRGNKPLDDIDTCCRKHDNCYGDVSCYWFYPQWVGYTMHCPTSNTNNNTNISSEPSPCQCTDDPYSNPCSYTTCRCDLALAECLRNATYHEYYRAYNRQLCNHVPLNS